MENFVLSFKINIVMNVCCFEAKTRAPSFLPILESVTTNFQVLRIILRLALKWHKSYTFSTTHFIFRLNIFSLPTVYYLNLLDNRGYGCVKLFRIHLFERNQVSRRESVVKFVFSWKRTFCYTLIFFYLVKW